MGAPRFGGLQVRGLDTRRPIADLYCVACSHHERVTGTQKVTDYLRANPLADHRARCRSQTT